MSKVFRIHKEGVTSESGWFNSNAITSNQLDSIITDGKGITTSIPSPFARIDLVKSAFRWVSQNKINEQSAQHKLVSDALDVGQLFFLSRLYPEIEIIEWNPNERFEELEKYNHKDLAKTLKTYWEQDGKVYNFNKVGRLFFILYNKRLVGGTSPATLFFAAPDANAEDLNMNILRGSDKLLDNKYASLAHREWAYVEYIYSLSKTKIFKNFFTSTGHDEFYEYLEQVKKSFSPEDQLKIDSLDEKSVDGYDKCYVSNAEKNYVDVLGMHLGLQTQDSNKIASQSQFVIKSKISNKRPLILPSDAFSLDWVYSTNDIKWDGEQMRNKVPFKNDASESESRLPVQKDKYYWLSTGNFLEEKLIELPYAMDSIKFKTCGSKKHLLPLTTKFFEYFTVDEVENMLIIAELYGGGVEAKLEIPVEGGMLQLKHTYHKSDIVIMEIHLAILPFLRTSCIDLDYTIGIQDKRYERSQEIFIECYKSSNNIKTSIPVIRKQGEGKTIKSTYYKTKSFDAIRIISNSHSAFIIPLINECNANQQISFAIDFGTTNTHIEYKFGANAEKAIDITSDQPMWQSMIDRKTEDSVNLADDNNFEREIFPYEFNNIVDYKFPFRTALTYNQTINFNEPIDVFLHTNNFFLFEKKFYSKYVKLQTRLKWSNYTLPEDKKLVEKYIECLIYIVLYKTLLLNGNPQTSKINWFYPISMDSFEQGIFFEVWEKAYKKIFNVDNVNNINAIPESIAPYLYYRANYPGLSLSIDIGGGSSDIAVFKNANNLPEFISSFKFAGNAIFGDGFPNGPFANSSDNNGFVSRYRAVVETAIGQNSNKNEILEDILKKRKDSADFSSFLFSLENENDIELNYTNLLRQDRYMKLPIFVFYGAVIYYCANLLEKNKIKELPKNILFSGTASKTIRILDSKNAYPNISSLFKFIFKNVLGLTTENLNVVLSESPKEVTCKGVLKADLDRNIENCPMVFWLGGGDDSIWSKAFNKKTDIPNTPYYRDLEASNSKSIIEDSINDFFGLLDDYISTINLEGDFGIENSAYQKFKKMRTLNIKDFLEHGVKAFYRSPEKHIEETLFFYPLIGILNKLALVLSNPDN